MRKTVLILTILCLLFSLTACSDPSAPAKPTKPAKPAAESGNAASGPANPARPDDSQTVESDPEASLPADSQAPETKPDEPGKVFEPVVLIDNEVCTVRALSAEHEEVWGLQVKLSCENKSETNLLFSLDQCTINGYFVEPGWIQQVNAGETRESEFNIFESEMERCGFERVDELRFRLLAKDMDHYGVTPLAEEQISLYPTGKTPDQIVIRPRELQDTDHPVTADDRFSFVITGVDPEGFWGHTLYLYLENNTDQPLAFTWKDVEVNGAPVEPNWVYELPAGMYGYTFLSISREELAAAEVANPNDYNFLLNVYDAKTYEDLFAEHCSVIFR